ncbi:cyclase family protein [Microseira wollei]|uniref:Acyl-CoA dehydrogenase family protein n=1 Tax=Microseira wollei NIES-4236 TaxID=2530354 RepID=A0AAV3XQL2_9CYAN|nr:cyclase family protein [Microseira wollei]GET43079.1 acyl-CoA dehydrogenase family protein [Microseira wollei NIES-4236]
MKVLSNLLDSIESYLQRSVAPIANKIDRDSDTLFQALQGLGELGVLALRIPTEWNGAGANEETFQSFQELVARYSGALAFLQVQHQSAAGMIFEGRNSSLMQAYLPRMSNGEVLLGIGFSQLRREGDPVILALPVDGGYLLNGFVPWVTGWGLFQEFIVAASLPDGRAVFGIVPLVETYQETGGNITFSQPMELAAMTSTNTVTATLKNWFLTDDIIVSIKPPGWIHENDKKNVLRSTFLAMGCARSGLDILENTLQNKSLPFIPKAFDSLTQELSRCRTAIKAAEKNPSFTLDEKLQLRAQAIDLAGRCAHAAVTVSSGAANYINHPAQRVYREALVFTVTGQTTAVMEATLKQLTQKNPEAEPPYYRSQAQPGSELTLEAEPPYYRSQAQPGSELTPSQAQPGYEGREGLPTAGEKSITYSKVIDLSHIIDPDIPQWPGDPKVEFETIAEIAKDGYYLRRFSLGEHSATHMNAPNSFHASGVGIDAYSAESLIVPAVVIDIRAKTMVDSDYELAIADILSWEQQYGQIPAGIVVLLYTGWQQKWSDSQAFLNQDADGNLHFPGFSSEATQFLLRARQIAGVGIDTHGVDAGLNATFATNRLVLEKPRIVLENLTNLDQLPPKGTTLVIGVLRLKGGSGSAAAVLAFVRNNQD